MTGWRWHQLDHMQIICIFLRTDNHTSTNHTSTSPLTNSDSPYYLVCNNRPHLRA